MAAKKSSFLKKTIFSFLIIFFLGGGLGLFFAYKAIYKPNVSLGEKKSQIIYIPTGSDFNDVVAILTNEKILVNRATFEWLAERKNYKKNIKPGKYRILSRMGNNELVNVLRAGIQEPVKIYFEGIRTKPQLITRVCLRLEADSMEMKDKLSDRAYLGKYGMDENAVLTLFIPATYEFFWNTSVDEFMERMAAEYKKFWNDERKAKAKKIGLSQSEVAILASIVQAEQWRFDDEKPVVAGLYYNRLKKGMPLQSDPTLIYALGDFSINRVLNVDKEVDSPYNTYKNIGLPPGVICLPERSSLDAVLNYEQHDYLFMCAKEDFSGRHYFSKNYEQHKIYAQKYRAALDKRSINR